MTLSPLARRIVVVASVGVGVVAVASALILLAGADPVVGLRGFVDGVSSSPYRVGELLVGAVPVALIALSLIPALRAGVFSVGAEGQVIIGAIAATAAILGVGQIFGDDAPSLVFWLAGAGAGALGGLVYAVIPAILAVRWRVNEILSTLLLNYVAIGILGWSLRTWLASGEQTATPKSAKLPDAAAIPSLLPDTRAHWGLVLAVVAAIGFWWWQRSSASVRVTVFASRPRLAARLGATRTRTILTTMMVSGIGAGIVGWIQVAGIGGRLLSSVSGGVGFSGVAVALLGALLPPGVVLAALFFSALTAGAVGLQSATGTVPSSIAEVIKGVLVLGVACVSAVHARAVAAAPPDPVVSDVEAHEADDRASQGGAR